MLLTAARRDELLFQLRPSVDLFPTAVRDHVYRASRSGSQALFRAQADLTEALLRWLLNLLNTEYLGRPVATPKVELSLRGIATKATFGERLGQVRNLFSMLNCGSWVIPELQGITAELPASCRRLPRVIQTIKKGREDLDLLRVTAWQKYIEMYRGDGRAKTNFFDFVGCVGEMRNADSHDEKKHEWWLKCDDWYEFINGELLPALVDALQWEPLHTALTQLQVIRTKEESRPEKRDSSFRTRAEFEDQRLPLLGGYHVVSSIPLPIEDLCLVRRLAHDPGLFQYLGLFAEFPRPWDSDYLKPYLKAALEFILDDGAITEEEDARLRELAQTQLIPEAQIGLVYQQCWSLFDDLADHVLAGSPDPLLPPARWNEARTILWQDTLTEQALWGQVQRCVMVQQQRVREVLEGCWGNLASLQMLQQRCSISQRSLTRTINALCRIHAIRMLDPEADSPLYWLRDQAMQQTVQQLENVRVRLEQSTVPWPEVASLLVDSLEEALQRSLDEEEELQPALDLLSDLRTRISSNEAASDSGTGQPRRPTLVGARPPAGVTIHPELPGAPSADADRASGSDRVDPAGANNPPPETEPAVDGSARSSIIRVYSIDAGNRQELPIRGRSVQQVFLSLLRFVREHQIPLPGLPFRVGRIRYLLAETPHHHDGSDFRVKIEEPGTGVFVECHASRADAAINIRKLCSAMGLKVEVEVVETPLRLTLPLRPRCDERPRELMVCTNQEVADQLPGFLSDPDTQQALRALLPHPPDSVRYLLNGEPRHGTGLEFTWPKQIAEDIHLEVRWTWENLRKHLVSLFERLGSDGSLPATPAGDEIGECQPEAAPLFAEP